MVDLHSHFVKTRASLPSIRWRDEVSRSNRVAFATMSFDTLFEVSCSRRGPLTSEAIARSTPLPCIDEMQQYAYTHLDVLVPSDSIAV